MARVFWASRIPSEGLAKAWTGFQARLKHTGWTGSYVPWENVHLTWVFVGDIASGTVPAIIEAVGRRLTESRSPIRWRITQAGSFGVPAPRVIWVGSHKIPESMADLHRTIRRGCQEAGVAIQEGPSWRPHITVLRVKHAGAVPWPEWNPVTGVISAIELLQTQWDAQGVRYQTLASFPLGDR